MPRHELDSGGPNYVLVASELLRALRGERRSRPGFSRYLGYRSNIAQRWETQQCFPSATRFFWICERLRLDVPSRVSSFLRREPSWLRRVSLTETPGVVELLGELRGRTKLGIIAERCRWNRSSVSRCFSGSADPTLPHFLAIVDACGGRVLDLVAAFVDPKTMPSVAKAWKELTLSRYLAYEHPMSHAVLRALELDEYAKGGYRDDGYLARCLGMKPADVERALSVLADSGQAKKTRRGWRARPGVVVDTGGDPARARALRLTWAKIAVDRLDRGAPGHSGYSLFAVSRKDLRRLREIQLAYVREMQTVISASKPGECVGLYVAQLLDLAEAPDNVFGAKTPDSMDH